MANHVRSRVEVESPTKEIHEFMSKFDDSCTGLFETESGPNTCKVVFGDDWKFNIDDIGSKWIFAEEAAYSDFEEGLTDELVFTSALSFPEDDEIEPLDWDNEDDDYKDEHWDMIDEAKWSCVESAKENLND